MNPRTRAIASIVLRLVLFGGLLTLGVWFVDLDALSEVTAQLSLGVVATFLAVSGLARCFVVLRWWFVCSIVFRESGRVSLPFLLRVQLIAEFVNLWVPSFVGGEVGRVVYLKDRAPSLTQAVAAVALDRILGFVGLALAAVPFGWVLLRQVQAVSLPSWVYGLLVLALVLVALPIAWVVRRRREQLDAVLVHLGVLRTGGVRAVGALLSAMGAAFVLVFAYWPFFASVHPIPFSSVAAITLFSRFGRIVPVQFMGVNSVEGLVVLLGDLYGVPAEVLALALTLGVSQKIVFSLTGAVVELAVSGRDFVNQLRGKVSMGPP